jgi:5-methylcytosine-specific restriction endonuclease McrA
MTRPGDPAPDCRFSKKAAVRVERAAPSRGSATAAGAPGANADCRFPGEGGVRDPLPATGTADTDTLQKHTFGGSAADTCAEAHARSHTTEGGSPSIGDATAAAVAPSAARSRAGAFDGAGAGDARSPANDATCANTAPPAGCSTLPVDAAGSEPPVGGPVDPPFSAELPGVPTAVSHGATPEKVNAGAQVGAIAKPRIWSWLREEVDTPWGRSLDEDGNWVEHRRCRSCGCIEKRPHFTRGYCKPCYSRSPFGRTRNYKQYVERRERMRANDRDGQWLRVMVAAARKSHIDRNAGLVPDYSVIAYCVTCKLFNGRCAFCNSLDNLTIDHHYPAAAGTPIEPGNAVLLCRACNASKGRRLPEEFYGPEQLARIERTLQLAVELTPLMEKLLPRLDLRRIRGRPA